MKRELSLLRKASAGLLLASVVASGSGPAFARGAGETPKSLTTDQKIIHVLNRLGFGPRPGDLEKVRATGLEKYIQLQLSPSAIPDPLAERKVAGLEVLKLTTSEIFAKYPNPGALIQMLEGPGAGNAPGQTDGGRDDDPEAVRQERRAKIAKLYREYELRPANRIMLELEMSRILRATYSERQLEEVMVDFWANHFNVFSGKAATRWYIPSFERDVIRKHALGNFRDLLGATARHPAMLFYLDNFQSVSPDSRNSGPGQQRLQRAIRNGKLDPRVRDALRSRGLSESEIEQRVEMLKQGVNNQNRRGINENYARELMELHTLGVDGGYTQKDIQEVARAFTGWTIFDARGYRKAASAVGSGADDRRIVQRARQLGVPADTESGSFVFVSQLHDRGPKNILGQKVNEGGIRDGERVLDLLVSHPSTAKHIARKLAVKFVSDTPKDELVERVARAFSDSKGDIRTTLRALFSDEEFFAPENYRAKIKTPFELMISALRAVGAETNGSPALSGLLRQMGEPLYGYQAPTGYPDTAADWVSTGGLLERMNFAVALASGRIPRTSVDLRGLDAPEKAALLDNAIAAILSGEISESTRTALLKQMEEPLPEIRIGANDTEMMRGDAQAAGSGIADRRADRRLRQTRSLAPTGDPELFKAVGLILGSPEFQRQ